MDTICQPYKSGTGGVIDLAEFVHIAENWRREQSKKQSQEPIEQMLKRAMQDLDANNDGNVQVREFREQLMMHGDKLAEFEAAPLLLEAAIATRLHEKQDDFRKIAKDDEEVF